MKRSIRIEKLGRAGNGYRVLVSWKRPSEPLVKGAMDVWIPELAPSHVLRRRYEAGIHSWGVFCKRYGIELRSPFSQNMLKPLALLSRRRVLVLLCDCAERAHCPHKLLARAVDECRKRKNFTLGYRRLS